MHLKKLIKKGLAAVGLVHPSLGIKISQDEKARIILEHKTPALKTFVETGTSQAWMVERMKDVFEKIYSIELDDSLYAKARAMFAENEKIVLLHGDSAEEIKKVLAEVREPALFWLDAHPEGPINASNSPFIAELEAVFSHPIKSHTILIDDARHFDRKSISKVKKLARAHGYRFKLENGIFRLYGA